MVAHSNGMCLFELGNPEAASVIVAMPLVVWFRPVIRHDRGRRFWRLGAP